MFHTYFGAFDVVAYAIATIFAILWASAICNEQDDQERLEPEEDVVQSVHVAKETPLVLDAPFFELHGTLVVRKDDIPVPIPASIKVLSLRSDPVVRLTDLCHVYGRVAINAEQVSQKWEQWSKHNRKRKKEQSRKPIETAVTLNGGSGYGTDPAFTV